MTWQILLIISIVTYAISIILQRVLLRDNKSDPIAYTIVFQFLSGILIGIYALFNGFHLPDFSHVYLNLIVMTVLYAAGNVLIFASLKKIEASEFTILFSTRSLWVMVGAVVFLHEAIVSQHLLGTILILLSVVLVSWKKKQFTLSRGGLYAVLAAGAFGLAFVNDAFIIGKTVDVPSYLFIAFTLPGIAVLAAFPRSVKKMKPLLETKTLIKLLILGVFYSVSAITIFLAYQVGQNAAQIGPLNLTSTILTVILSVVILKETDFLLRKLIGTIISFVGVLLLQ